MLLFKSVTAEDASEIKFTAEKVSSTANLKVKGTDHSRFMAVHLTECSARYNSTQHAVHNSVSSMAEDAMIQTHSGESCMAYSTFQGEFHTSLLLSLSWWTVLIISDKRVSISDHE